MVALELVQLPDTMARGQGESTSQVDLIDRPEVLDHPDLTSSTIRETPEKLEGECSLAVGFASADGTLAAGMLSARRGSAAPAIGPGCTLLLRRIPAETANGKGKMPSHTRLKRRANSARGGRVKCITET